MKTIYQSYLIISRVLGIALGGSLLILGFMHQARRQRAGLRQIFSGLILLILGSATPSAALQQLSPVATHYFDRMA